RRGGAAPLEERAGDPLPRRLRLGCGVPPALAPAEAEVRPRRGIPASGRPNAARHLPPQPADHVHRQAHRADDRRGVCACAPACPRGRPGLPALRRTADHPCDRFRNPRSSPPLSPISAATDVLIARQPVYDLALRVVAYELLVQRRDGSAATGESETS